jgi:hypothetical protein
MSWERQFFAVASPDRRAIAALSAAKGKISPLDTDRDHGVPPPLTRNRHC